MKKLLFLLIATLSTAIIAACGLIEDDPEETSRVEFYNSEGWENVYAQAEDGDGEQLLGEFPGEEAAQVDDREDWWYVDIPVANFLNEPVNVTFNDGDEQVSGGATVNHPDFIYLTIEEGGVYGTRGAAEFAMREVDETRVYFYNSEGWDDIRVWAWDEERDFYDSWPGEPAEEHEEADWWYKDVPADADEQDFGIIFNGLDEDEERAQTGDIEITDREYVYLTVEDTKSASMQDALDALEEARAQTVVYFYNHEGWANVYATATADDLDFTDVAASEHDADNWYYVEVPIAVAVDRSFDIHFSDGNDSMSIEATIAIDEEGETPHVYLTVDALYGNMISAEAWTHTAIEDMETIYFYNVHGWTDMNAYTWSEDADEVLGPWPGMEVSHDEGDWYYINVPFDLEQHFIDVFIFNGLDEDGEGVQTGDIELDDPDYIYVTPIDEVFTSKADAEDAVEEALAGTTVYFYNIMGPENTGWANVYATVEHDDLDEEFVDVAANAADMDDWYYVEVPLVVDDEVSFTITFHDANHNEIENLIENDTYTFVTTIGLFRDPLAAELQVTTPEDQMTRVYFYNSEGWDTLYAYLWSDDYDDLLGAWPGLLAESDEDEGWYYIDVPAIPEEAAFNIIFNDPDLGEQTDSILIDNSDLVYTNMNNEAHQSKEDAEDALTD